VDEADGYVSGVSSGEVRPAGSSEIHGDLSPRVAGTHHKHVSLGQLIGVAIGAGVELHDLRVELRGEIGDFRVLVGPRSYDDVLGHVTLVPGAHQVAVVVTGQRIDMPAEAHG
jgi:hypothetical protein